MAERIRAYWDERADGYTRKDRRGCWYEAYVPDMLDTRAFLLDGETAADLSDAERFIVELDRRADALVDTEALARLLLRAEAVASSRIEGLRVEPRRLLELDAVRGDPSTTLRNVTASEVLANIDAMAYAIGAVAPESEITLERLLETHRRLLGRTSLAHHAGRLRTVQNWIGGSDYNPCAAAFVPPPPDRVEALMTDLCRFCNDDRLSPAAQAAVAHGQFEAIHPFVDGNGRVGRALIHMILRKRGLVRNVLPPISLVLATQAEGYVRALNRACYVGDALSKDAIAGVNGWLSLFAGACIGAVKSSEAFEDRISDIQSAWRARLGETRSHAAVHDVLRVLPGAPIVSVKTAAELTGRSVTAVNEALTRLLERRIVHQTNAQARNRVFEATDVIDAFVALERGLASHARDTAVARPVRPVPARPPRAAHDPRTQHGRLGREPSAGRGPRRRPAGSAPEDTERAFRNRQP